MAKIKYTAIIADMRNKLGGSTFTKCRGGSFIRNKPASRPKVTIYHQKAQNNFTSIQQSFRKLTQSQIAGWNAGSLNLKTYDVFGSAIQPSGINLYCMFNINLKRIGLSPISSFPRLRNVSPLTAFSCSTLIFFGWLTIAWAPDLFSGTNRLVISATRQVSPGVSNFGDKYVDLAWLDTGWFGFYVFSNEYTDKFGPLITGRKIGMKIQLINTLTGQAGVPLYSSCIVD